MLSFLFLPHKVLLDFFRIQESFSVVYTEREREEGEESETLLKVGSNGGNGHPEQVYIANNLKSRTDSVPKAVSS